MSNQFYICQHCGNIIGMVKDKGVPVVCCGEKMKALTANTVEASAEKHLPVLDYKDSVLTVNIGSADHPMLPEHYIEWVYVKTDKGGHRKNLSPGEKPSVKFCMCDEKPLEVYAYCNLHGLWMTELK